MSGKLLLVGGGGHALATIDVIERTGAWTIVGVVDADLPVGTEVGGYPVLGNDDVLPDLRRQVEHAVVTVGQIRSAEVRMRLFQQLIACGYGLPALVSPLASLSRRAAIGRGSVLMHFAAVGPDAVVGNNTIINSGALLEHGARVGDHCHISTGVLLNGDVAVGDGSFVGSGSVVKEGVTIGAGCLVGMGSRLRHDLPDSMRYVEKTG